MYVLCRQLECAMFMRIHRIASTWLILQAMLISLTRYFRNQSSVCHLWEVTWDPLSPKSSWYLLLMKNTVFNFAFVNRFLDLLPHVRVLFLLWMHPRWLFPFPWNTIICHSVETLNLNCFSCFWAWWITVYVTDFSYDQVHVYKTF